MKKTKIRTHNFFNLGTQRALYEKVGGYVNKEFYMHEYIQVLQQSYNLEKIYRFDLGQNNDGCAPEVEQLFNELSREKVIRKYLKNYPEFLCHDLTRKIAELHRLNHEEWVLLSAGLDQMISIISSAFLELNDRVLVNSPSFYLFREYSKRMGAIVISLHLREEDQFKWTTDTFDEYREVLKKLNPKLIWIANPNNPTGAACPRDLIEYIVDEAEENFAFVVVDEAYGEYVDPDEGISSASRLLEKHRNLIVLRTFSKAYGLASLRIAYALTCNDDILRAMRIHSNYFPITQFSFDLAREALKQINYLEKVRKNNEARRATFVKELDDMKHISYIDSRTNIMMLKHNSLSEEDFINQLERNGIIVAKVSGDEDSVQDYIRMTMSTEEENRYFIEVLKKVAP